MSPVFGSSDQDQVFRALADPVRREILDRLRESPGMNVGELAEEFDRSRYSVMRHLNTLEGADLVVSRKVGRERQLYLNAGPIQALYDRWISRHAEVLATTVGALRRRLEAEAGPGGTLPPGGPGHRYVEFIRTTPEGLWDALTTPSETSLYFHGLEVESDFRVGSPIRYRRPAGNGSGDGEVEVDGVIFEADPGRRLAHTFRFPEREDPQTRVAYGIEPLGSAVRLTLVHDGFEEETESFRIAGEGWPPILSALKTYLETGEPLELPATH